MLHIGNKIKTLMRQQHMDAPELARRLGKSKQAVYMMLEKQDLSTALLRQMADVFSVPLNFFLTNETDEKLVASKLRKELNNLKAEVEQLDKRVGKVEKCLLSVTEKGDKSEIT